MQIVQLCISWTDAVPTEAAQNLKARRVSDIENNNKKKSRDLVLYQNKVFNIREKSGETMEKHSVSGAESWGKLEQLSVNKHYWSIFSGLTEMVKPMETSSQYSVTQP